VLVLCNPLNRLLGERGLLAVQRLMGMLLTTIAVQMFLTGVRDFLAVG
jgi:small neutral amino acid transporter SnatA (MarC family)